MNRARETNMASKPKKNLEFLSPRLFLRVFQYVCVCAFVYMVTYAHALSQLVFTCISRVGGVSKVGYI